MFILSCQRCTITQTSDTLRHVHYINNSSNFSSFIAQYKLNIVWNNETFAANNQFAVRAVSVALQTVPVQWQVTFSCSRRSFSPAIPAHKEVQRPAGSGSGGAVPPAATDLRPCLQKSGLHRPHYERAHFEWVRLDDMTKLRLDATSKPSANADKKFGALGKTSHKVTQVLVYKRVASGIRRTICLDTPWSHAGRVAVLLHSFLTATLDGGHCNWVGGWVDPGRREKSLSPCRQSPARVLVAILTELSRLHFIQSKICLVAVSLSQTDGPATNPPISSHSAASTVLTTYMASLTRRNSAFSTVSSFVVHVPGVQR